MGHLLTLRACRDRTGSVLILSLWVLAMLFCLAMSLSYQVRLGLRLSRYAWDEIRLVQLAKMAVRDCLSNKLFKDRALGEGSYSVIHGQDYGPEDESARINLNKASPETLKRLLAAHAEVVPAILDWRGPAGANSMDYSGSGYSARHGPFKCVHELLLVKGMTPEIFRDVQDLLTVDTSGEININTASERVLEAIGLPSSLVNKILWFRQSGNGGFSQTGSIASLLKSSTFITDDELQSLAQAIQANQLAVQSNTFHLNIVARLNDSRAVCRAEVVAAGRLSDVRILQWWERRR